MLRRKTNKGARPPVEPFLDEHGRRCVRVPLDAHGSAYATTLEADYRAVRSAGATGVWYLNANDKGQRYVRTAVPDGQGGFVPVSVARIIIGAGPRSTIFFVNKDRLDLRPENLFWHRKGKSKRRDVELAERGARYRQQRNMAQQEASTGVSA